MPEAAPPTAPSALPEPSAELLVVVAESAVQGVASSFAASLQSLVEHGMGGRPVAVLVAVSRPEPTLLAPDEALLGAPPEPGGELAVGGISGAQSVLGAVLREADRRNAGAVALLSGTRREGGVDWLHRLLAPILEQGLEYVCPTYRRARFDGLLGTSIVYPLTRALYGVRLRQPAGGETALSIELARALLADPDWRLDAGNAGSDAWLIAKVLSERRRACQVWAGPWPGDGAADEDASHALARLVGPLFREMERHVARWQRVDGSVAPPTFGEPGPLDEPPVEVDVAPLAATFRLGLRELDEIWSRVLPPATRFALQRAAVAAPAELRLDDALWARVVYDFAVAHATRAIERRQLLRSMAPLYLGWVASFVNAVRAFDAAAVEARVEALCAAFEREKRYAIRRWRWPDSFAP